MNKKDLPNASPSAEYFKLPLYLASFTSFLFKILFGITGAMSLNNDDYNIFSNILYSKQINEGILLTLTAFVGFVILPAAIEQLSQCKYFASSSSENDTIPCN